ncbi:MAG TPA: glycosyltransferase family 1 protein [Candidatus Methanoperedens sp.]|nr:glycosyltransferase family 1 protein [Candidatus Methanoperedens sp.]
MIIGIDVSSTAYGTGVSNYTLNLVRHLLKNDRQNTYKLFYSSLRLPISKEITALTKYKNVQIYQSRFPQTLLSFLWNKLHILPIEFFIGRADIFHTSDWTQPPSIKAKTLTTVHDLTPFLYPKWLHKKIVTTHHQKMYWASRKCHHFICVSENTKNDLLKIFPKISPSKCSVIYEAAEDKYGEFLKLSKEKQFKKISSIEKQYGLGKYILSQGTREPRKNLPSLIAAFNLYRQKYPKSRIELAITGKYGWGKDVLHLKNPFIKILGYIPEKDMVSLHAKALFLAYPSLYEGFGLPLIKSMKVGVPVLSSNTSSMPEVVGDSGILVDPTSIDSIYHGILKLLSSSSLRHQLSQKSIKAASKFSWDITAQNTLELYKSIININNSITIPKG